MHCRTVKIKILERFDSRFLRDEPRDPSQSARLYNSSFDPHIINLESDISEDRKKFKGAISYRSTCRAFSLFPDSRSSKYFCLDIRKATSFVE